MYLFISALTFLIYATSSCASNFHDQSEDKSPPRFELTVSDQYQDTYKTAYGNEFSLNHIVECLQKTSFPPEKENHPATNEVLLTKIRDLMQNKQGILVLGSGPTQLESVWLMTELGPNKFKMRLANYEDNCGTMVMTNNVFPHFEGLKSIRIKISESQREWSKRHGYKVVDDPYESHPYLVISRPIMG